MADTDPAYDLGLWLLRHPDLKRTAPVLAFRDHRIEAINERRALLDGSGVVH